MTETHFFPARVNEFGYVIIDITDDGKAILERHPLIGFATQISESRFQKVIVQTRPICTVGDNLTPDFIQRYDGSFTDCNGERLSHSLAEMMQCFGFEPEEHLRLQAKNGVEGWECHWRIAA